MVWQPNENEWVGRFEISKVPRTFYVVYISSKSGSLGITAIEILFKKDGGLAPSAVYALSRVERVEPLTFKLGDERVLVGQQVLE
jgi:hypothetical protein